MLIRLLFLSGVLLGGASACDSVERTPEGEPRAYAAPQATDALLATGGPEGLSDTTVAAGLSKAFRAAAQRALPAVVSISVERSASMDAPSARIPEPFRFFFDLPDGSFSVPPQRGQGSGFIIDEEGRVLTNRHVIDGADQIWIILEDGREYPADVIGSDPMSDLAVLRFDPESHEPLPVARLGDSDAAQVGDWVLALGNPMGLDFTVTAGIVSAKGRSLSGREAALEAFIQTDAPINPGNSGGPLIDLYGRVVGINTAISGGDHFVGYGFAVPINLARRILEDLEEFGHVRRPRLGVRVSSVTAVDAEAYGLERVAGAEVNSVEDDAPAGQAGLEPGDVVVALDGRPITDATSLTTALVEHHPGDLVTLTIVRDGRSRDVKVELGEFPVTETSMSTPGRTTGPTELLGFEVAPLSPDVRRRLGADVEAGALISRVLPYSPAARAGVRRGQILTEIDGREIRSETDVLEAVRSVEAGEVVSLRVWDPELGRTVVNFRTRRDVT